MKKIIFLLPLMNWYILSFAQIALVEQCAIDPFTLPSASPGMPYFASFTSGDTNPMNAWTVSAPTLPSSIFDISSTGVLSALPFSGSFGNHSVTITKGAEIRSFTLPVENCTDITPCRTEFAFVMDQSGSMEIDGRWNTLKTTLNDYMTSLSTIFSLGVNDSLALFLYEGNNVRVVDRSDFTDLPNLDPDTGVLSAYNPAGTTPIGGGIQGALQRFFRYPGVPWKRQVIVVITDGRQNRNPWLSNSSRQIYTNTSEIPIPGILGPGSGPGALPINFDSPGLTNFIVHNIGIGVGTGGPEYSLLESFATEHYFYSTDNSSSLTLDAHLTDSDVVAFKGCTPRILEMSFESINSTTQSKTIIVNDSIQYLTLRFLAEGRFSEPRIEIYYNDTIQDITPVLRNNKQILYRIDFLSSRNGFIRRGKGNWRVTFSDPQANGPMPMLFTAIVEDKNIHHSLDFNGVNKFYAGDAIPVRVKVEKDQEPLNQQVTVKAFLLRPGDDLGDLAARNAFDPPSAINPDLTPGQVKMDFIAGSKDFSELLKTLKIPEITLNPIGNGEYVGSFQGNEVTGAYQVVSYIQGTYPALGSFQGRESRFAHVDFSRPEDIRLRDNLVLLGKTDNGSNHYQIQIRPMNKFGRFLGPAQEARIKFTLSNGNVGEIRDNLDGTYSASLEIKEGTNPRISFHVIDFKKPVEVKKLSRYDSLGFVICLGAGVSIPSQNLQNFKPGIFGEIGFGYRFTPNISLELLGGGYTFRRNHHILGASLWGKYTFNQVVQPLGLDLNLGLGAGIFKPKGMNTELGYGLRAGLSKNLEPWFRLGLDFSLFKLSNSNISFATIGLGAQFRL